MPKTARRAASDTYFKLVRQFPLRRIRSAAEYSSAKEVHLRLSQIKVDRGTRDYLDVLGDLIEDYERRENLTIDTSDLVRHKLEQRGMSISALAEKIGIPQPNLSGMLLGRRSWSKTAIKEISRRLNIPRERFLS